MSVAVQGTAHILRRHIPILYRRREELLRSHNLPVTEPPRHARIRPARRFEPRVHPIRLGGRVREARVVRVDSRVHHADHHIFSRTAHPAGSVPSSAREGHVVGSVGGADAHQGVALHAVHRGVVLQQGNLANNQNARPVFSIIESLLGIHVDHD